MYQEDNEYWKNDSEEEAECKGCGDWFPMDHLTRNYLCIDCYNRKKLKIEG